MKELLFLGGTAANNKWREEKVIPALVAAGIPASALFNPVVENWDATAQANEDRVKDEAPVQLYYLADPRQEGNPISAYSIFEAQRALYRDPGRTVVIFDHEGLAGHPLKQAQKIFKDLKRDFPGAPIFDDVAEGVN